MNDATKMVGAVPNGIVVDGAVTDATAANGKNPPRGKTQTLKKGKKSKSST